ncbi:MAG TPA: hypothetical protein VFF73_38935 [Planctomycetota bacterium]|nr:hypothetical protein [Planctomycetota bacterium]
MNHALEDLEEHGSDLDEAADAFLRAAWRSSPGIFMSLVFHGLLLAGLPFIIFQEKIRELAGIPITIGVDAVRLDPERPYRPVSSAPPAPDGQGLDEPPAPFPSAIPAERNESAENKTDSTRVDGSERTGLQFLASDPAAAGFRGRMSSGPPGTNDVLGVGGGSGRGGARGGGGFGGQGGRQSLVARGGGSAATEAAVSRGLSWLARHQCADGAWRAKDGCTKCPKEDFDVPDVATTSLAVVAFIAAGYGPRSHVEIKDPVTGTMLKPGDTVRAALKYLQGRVDAGVPVKSAKVKQDVESGWPSTAYEHAFATMAFCEAYRASKDAALGRTARKLLDHLVDRQNPGRAWQYGYRDGGNDISVTGACVQALRSARLAGLEIPAKSVDGVRSFLGYVSAKDGNFGYTSPQAFGQTGTAIGVYIAKFLDPGGTGTTTDSFAKLLPRSAENVAKTVGNAQTCVDLYGWYYAMLGLFEYEGPKGASWKSVNEAVTTALLRMQRRGDGCICGSWDCAGDIYLGAYGRPIATAMAVLTLEVYYRYATVLEPEPASAVEPAATAAPR